MTSLPPPEQARSDILGSGLSKTTIANALALLDRAHPYNGHITITKESLCDLWGLVNWGSAQRYLGRIAQPGIIHYTTNRWVYVTFRAWPPTENGAPSLPNRRVGSTEMRVGSTVFDSDENPNWRVGSTEMRVGSTESVRGVYQKSAYKELNERKNESLIPEEVNQSIAVLTDPEIRMSRVKAEEIANAYPFKEIRAFCCNFVAEGRRAGKDAGLIAYWLEAKETVPPLAYNDLWRRHRTPAEIADEERQQAEAAEYLAQMEAEDAARRQRQAEAIAAPVPAPAPAPVPADDRAGQLWQEALDELALSMSRSTFETWLQGTQAQSYTDGVFVIGVPDAYVRDWLHNRLRPQVKRILGRLCQRSVEVTFAVRERADQPGGRV